MRRGTHLGRQQLAHLLTRHAAHHLADHGGHHTAVAAPEPVSVLDVRD